MGRAPWNSACFPGSPALMALWSAAGAPACVLRVLKLGVVVPPAPRGWGGSPGLFVLHFHRDAVRLCAPGHLQCSASALALSRGWAGRQADSACCACGARGTLLSRAVGPARPCLVWAVAQCGRWPDGRGSPGYVCIVPGSWSGSPALQGA